MMWIPEIVRNHAQKNNALSPARARVCVCVGGGEEDSFVITVQIA